MSIHNSLRGLVVLLCGLVVTVVASPSRADLVIDVDEEVRGNYEIQTDVVNNGFLAGLSPAQRITIGRGSTLSGAGALENTTVLGTFEPGNSPAITESTNLQIGGKLEIELGGTTPGFSSNNHDQINDSATLELLPSSFLRIEKFNNFIPADGDLFTILTWETELLGNFSFVDVGGFFTANGVDFTVNIINPTGPGSMVLQAVVIPESSQLLCGLVVCALVCGKGKRRHSPRD